MDRNAFKQRMQELKSYREQNPGKGYLDWKASKYAEGGEIPPERMEYKGKLYTDKNGRRYTEEQYQDYLKNSTDEISRFDGKPLVRGLKPVVDLEDAANITPVGDAIAIKDTYDAIRNNDWLGAGIAALTVLPFVPNSVKNFKREVPSVRRQGSDYLDRIAKAQKKEPKMATRLNNETYNMIERLMDDPSYMRRAQQVKDKYGDNYLTTYADMIQAYNENPELLPKAKGSITLGEERAKMQTTLSSAARHQRGGEFPKMGEYEYVFDVERGVPFETTLHETNHFADFLKNQSPYADEGSNLYKWMRSAIKPYSDKKTKYFAKPTEQKAYMNQLREFMYANKMIDTRDQIVDSSLIQKAIDKLPKGMNAVKEARDMFKSRRSYTKWFNTVPLLGVGALGVNKYFVNNEGENYDFRQER